MLAQEGVEITRSIRDNYWAAGEKGFPPTLTPTPSPPLPDLKECRVQDLADTICDDANSDYRLYLSASNFYNHSNTGSPTRFYRKIIIENPDDSKRIITSLVIWKGTEADFPATIAGCTTSTHCVYAQVNLTEWAK